jgi:UDP-N-acetylglucosamine 3-dehydrogenase
MWDQHADPAVAALEAGKHVFLEKPMASTVADCDRIVAAANAASGFFMTGHICRFNPRYAQTVQYRSHAHPDLGQVMYRLESGASCILEAVWCLPDTTPFQIDERLEIVGTEGSISIHDTHPNLMVVDKDGARCPDTTYWPTQHGKLRGALRDELAYFAQCVLDGEKPTVITPEESREAVRACLAAEESARTGQVVMIG